MPDDMYPSMDDEESSDKPADSGMDDKKESGYDTFLVPKSALSGDPEPGMKETIEIVHVYEDEIECRCTGGKSDKKSAMDEAGDSLDAMAMKGG